MQSPESQGERGYQEISEEKKARQVNWWLRLTSSGWNKPQETIEQREIMRRSRLLSWILLGLFVVLLVFIPATFKDHATLIDVCVALVGLIIIAFCNRRGWVTVAGVLLVVLIIGATFGVIVGSPDGKIHVVDLPAYDFLVLPIILGASILPRASAFIIAAINVALIYWDMMAQGHSSDLLPALHQYGYPVLAGRPTAIMVITAVIAFLWVRGMDQAVKRADRAEELRAIERQFTQAEAERSTRVEEFVQETINALGALANGQEGLMLLPPSHPWQQQATFINTQLKQFHKLKQANRGNNEQIIFAAETLLRLLQRITSRQAPVYALDPRQFSTRVALIDEIAKHLYFLLQSRPGATGSPSRPLDTPSDQHPTAFPKVSQPLRNFPIPGRPGQQGSD